MVAVSNYEISDVHKMHLHITMANIYLVLLNAYITNRVLTNSKITLKKHGKQLMVFFLEHAERKRSPIPLFITKIP